MTALSFQRHARIFCNAGLASRTVWRSGCWKARVCSAMGYAAPDLALARSYGITSFELG